MVTTQHICYSDRDIGAIFKKLIAGTDQYFTDPIIGTLSSIINSCLKTLNGT